MPSNPAHPPFPTRLRTFFLCLLLCWPGVASCAPAPEPGDSSGHAAGTRENRLAGESSPYLLLHRTNPVDWYPWGPEALEKAREEGKPIFLSVGYSTC